MLGLCILLLITLIGIHHQYEEDCHTDSEYCQHLEFNENILILILQCLGLKLIVDIVI